MASKENFFDHSVSPNASIFPKDKWQEAFHYVYLDDAYVRIYKDPAAIASDCWRWYIEFTKGKGLYGLALAGRSESPESAIQAAERGYKMVKREYCE